MPLQYKLSPKAQKLRDQLLVRPAICVEKAYYFTESYKETEGEPAIIRRAKSLDKVLNNISIRIEDGEKIVGWHSSKLRGGALLPEISAEWILDEMDHLDERTWDPYQPLEEKEKETIKEILPYWEKRSLFYQWQQMVPKELQQRLDHTVITTGGFCENGHHTAHVAVNFQKLLRLGLKGLQAEVDEQKKNLDPVSMSDFRKGLFLDAVTISYQAVVRFAERHAELAAQQAAAENDPARKAELLEIERVCRKVPWEPADTFYEALQSCWIVYVALMIEGWGAGMSLGRMDQMLYPYYKKEKEAGTISDEQVFDYLSLLVIKMNGVINPQSGMVSQFFGGYPVMQGVTVGGVDEDGNDAVNELTYLFLDAEQAVGLSSDEYVIRISDKNPDAYIKRALEVAVALHGKLKFVSDKRTIAGMLFNGIPLRDARNYISQGCHNPTVPAVTRDIGGASINFPLFLELALNDGKMRLTGQQIGPHTGDPRSFKSFDELLQAFYTQFESLTAECLTFKHADLYLHSQMPCPLLSSMYEGCIESGVDVIEGGGKYMFQTISPSGIPNVGDSLAAIKKTVFDDKTLTMDRLLTLLENDLEGDDEAAYLLKKAPKYGNNIPYVDEITRDVLAYTCDWLQSKTTFGGTRISSAALTMTFNIPLGKILAASADGRKAGEPLAEGGISPHQGRNTAGVTSTMASVQALDQVRLTHGSILNIRLNENAVRGEDKMDKMVALLRTFTENNGDLVQFNFVSNEMLRDAQKHPENYRDLMVRVATYSAFFVDLSPDLQNDIINRIEFEAI